LKRYDGTKQLIDIFVYLIIFAILFFIKKNHKKA